MDPSPPLGIAMSVDVGHTAAPAVDAVGGFADGQGASEDGGGCDHHLGAGQQLALPGHARKRPQWRRGVLPGQLPCE
ncbi:Uncharacterised protein [Mycobacterium tuberculosis]|nr:Uncharacterised protein [Mycobacterium tuberculosis]COZ64493.1 Uncharacterised protein [Mycobacterium tuberculosis]